MIPADLFRDFIIIYAYDDGSPEAGYGLSIENAELAYKFALNVEPDTLSSVEIFFNSTIDSANLQPFYLEVWDSKNGYPNNELYSKYVQPHNSISLDQFNIFTLDTALILKTDTFYIRMIQTTEDNLNIGFDLNDNSSKRIYYYIPGYNQWYNSMYSGSLMIRPILGPDSLQHVGIKEKKSNTFEATIYPNPLNGNTLERSISRGNKSQIVYS